MPATTLQEMRAGRQVLRKGDDKIHVIIKAIDVYIISDKRPSTTSGLEGTESQTWLEYDYDTARTTFNTDMADLGS